MTEPPGSIDLDETRLAIANRLRTARQMAGLSQGQVARMLGMHRPTVSEAEAGRRKVPAEELATFARLYRVSIAWLVGEVTTVDESTEGKNIILAARELKKLKPEDRRKLLEILSALVERTDRG